MFYLFYVIKFQVIHSLLYVMGNEDYPESQRQASKSLEIFIKKFGLVEERVREAIGDQLLEMLMVKENGIEFSETLFLKRICFLLFISLQKVRLGWTVCKYEFGTSGRMPFK